MKCKPFIPLSAPKKIPGASGQCDSTRGDSMRPYADHPSGRKACPKESTVFFPELACRLMDWPKGRQPVASFRKERLHSQPRGQNHARFEFEARSSPQGSCPPRPPEPSPSLLKPCFDRLQDHLRLTTREQIASMGLAVRCSTRCLAPVTGPCWRRRARPHLQPSFSPVPSR